MGQRRLLAQTPHSQAKVSYGVTMSQAGRRRGVVKARSSRRLGHWAGALSALAATLLFLSGCARPAAAPSVAGKFERREGSGVPQPTSEPLPVADNDIRWGNPHAPVTIVAFLDFECPFCARAHGTLTELLEAYGPEQLRLIVKHTPLPFHKRGVKAAAATQAVYELAGGEVFLAYVRRLFESPDNLSDSALAGRARELGITSESYQAALTSERVQTKVRADLELAERVGVNGVPAFYINGASIVGAMPKADFVAIIDHELRASQELLRLGVAPEAVFAQRVEVNWAPPEAESAAYEQVAYRVPVGTSPTIGPANAAVTIVEFADFECPFCQRAHETIETLMAKHPGQIRWVMKHNPLAFHPLAVPAAITALQIRQRKGDAEYWMALEKFYAAPKLSNGLLNQVAAEHGVEVATTESSPDAWLLAQLQADQDLAMDLDAQGTPHFFVNGRRLAGAQPLSVFEALVGEEIIKAAALGRVDDPYAALQQTALPPIGLTKHKVPPPPATSPSLGPANAQVVIQMFADFECGYCARALPTLAALRAKYPDKIKLVWRHLPLPFHKQAKRAAVASLEAQAQLGPSGFWRMAERLMGVPDAFADNARGPQLRPVAVTLNGETLAQAARELGLESTRFNQALEQGTHVAAIEADQEAARVLGVQGTPAFFVGPYALEGAQPLARFDRLVRLVLEESQ